MANTLRFKRGLTAGIPTGVAGEPLFTTDTFDLYIGNGTTNTRFQKYIASGTTSQYLRGDGSLATFPSLTGFVPYTGATANVDLGVYTILAQNATIASSGSGDTATITHSSGSGIGLNITKGGNGEGLYINKTSGSGNAATIIGTLNATTLVKSGGTSTQYLMADGTTSTLTNPITGTGTAGQVAYFTGATTQGGSANLVWDAANNRLGINATPATGNSLHVNGNTFSSTISTAGGISLNRYGGESYLIFIINDIYTAQLRALSGGGLRITGDSASNEWARFHSTGNFGIGTGATDSGQRLQVIGTGYFSDTIGIGSTSLTTLSSIRASRNISSDGSYGIYHDGQIQTAVTNNGGGYINVLQTIANTTLTNYYHYRAIEGTIGATTAITNNFGYHINDMATGTNRFGYYGNVASGTNKWNLYMNGTANNYMAGSLGIGGSPTLTSTALVIAKNITGGSSSAGIIINSTVQSDVTGTAQIFVSNPSTQAASFSITNLWHFRAAQGSIGAGSSIATQVGFLADSSINTGTFAIGFRGQIASGGSRYNLYMDGTAANYLNGNTLIGSTSDSGEKLQVTGTAKITGASTFTATGASISMTTSADSGIWSQVSNSGGFLYVGRDNSTGSSFGVANAHVIYGTAARPMVFFTNSLQRMTLDASGNLGLAVTPSAWESVTRAFQIGNSGSLSSNTSDFRTSVGSNFFINTAGTTTYLNTGFATQYMQISGTHRWFTAPSGTAGNAITFTQAMTLDASGRLGISTTSPQDKLTIKGATNYNLNLGLLGGYSAMYVYNDASSAYKELRIDSSLLLLNSYSGANVTIGAFTADTGEKLQVTGTAKITGATTFGAAVTGFIYNITGNALGTASTRWIGSDGGANGLFLNAPTAGNVYLAINNNNVVNVQSTGATITGSLSVTSTINSTSANGLAIGSLTGTQRIQYGSDVATSFTLLTAANAYAGLYVADLRSSTAIAIGTTPDSNNPFKILKNLNTTVGIKFENTNTSSLAFSAVQLGTDITGGTKFTNLVYASSGISASGVYNPDGTSLINNGSGGLNFLGNPIRMYTGGSNGVLRWDLVNDGYITHYSATAPTTSATDGYRQYSADVVAGNAAPHFRTENGAVIKLYQETTSVGNSTISVGGGSAVLDDTEFDGYTLRQIIKALRNQGILA